MFDERIDIHYIRGFIDVDIINKNIDDSGVKKHLDRRLNGADIAGGMEHLNGAVPVIIPNITVGDYLTDFSHVCYPFYLFFVNRFFFVDINIYSIKIGVRKKATRRYIILSLILNSAKPAPDKSNSD